MNAFEREAFVLLGVGIFVIGLRLYVRISTGGLKGLHLDDYLMVVAAVAYSVETYLAYSVGAFWKGLANNGMTDQQRRLLDPNSEEFRLRVNGSKTQIAGWSTYTFLLWTIKAAMCTFYVRLTEGLGYRKRVYAGFLLLGATWLAVFLSIILGCRPFHKNWQIYPNPGNYCQPAISRIDVLVTVVLNVLTDIYLMSIPIPLFWRSSLRPLKKAGLMLLFSGGIFVTAAGVLRCVLILVDPIHGAQQAGSWAVRETFVAVVTSNMPMIVPLIARLFRPVIGTLRSTIPTAQKQSKFSDSGDGKPKAVLYEGRNPRRGMGPPSINPIPNFTTINGSDEGINIRPEERTVGTIPENVDLEAGTAATSPTPRSGDKERPVEAVELRNMAEPSSWGDSGGYYHARLARTQAEQAGMAASPPSGWERSNSSLGFGIGIAL
ncbi:hypothetical protein VTI74DRAFT_8412 [Chaetomium olivicolor]